MVLGPHACLVYSRIKYAAWSSYIPCRYHDGNIDFDEKWSVGHRSGFIRSATVDLGGWLGSYLDEHLVLHLVRYYASQPRMVHQLKNSEPSVQVYVISRRDLEFLSWWTIRGWDA